MNIILLSGGSGRRLWPLSNDIRSKQFIRIFRTEDGGYESMIQRVYRRLKANYPEAEITVAAGKSQISAIRSQLGDDVRICAEPCRRDTFPAIALATAYICDVLGADRDGAAVVCPVDPYVDNEYFTALGRLARQAEKGEANLVLMGMEPDCPSEKYGYIIPGSKDGISAVTAFKEKPDAETAAGYIAGGALWNGGVFAYKTGYVLDRAKELTGYGSYSELLENYGELEKISFDYAVSEKEKSIQVMRFSGVWEDIGTWNALSGVMEEKLVGRVVTDGSENGLCVINELDIPVLCMGLSDMVVAAGADGILVSAAERADKIKPYADSMNGKVRYAEKSWGDYRVIDADENSLTVRITLKEGGAMSCHSHERRDEIWNIISGRGRVTVDGEEREVSAGDSVTVRAGSRHTVTAETRLEMIEVQLGRDISAADKTKYGLRERIK